MPKVGVKEILGEEYEVHASPYGRYSIHMPADEDGKAQELGAGETLDKAIANARIRINQQRVDVNVLFYDTQSGKRGTATKIHGKTRNVMARVGGESQQISPSTMVFKGDTPKMARDKYLKLRDEARKLTVEMHKITDAHTVRIGEVVNAAIKQAIEDQS